MAAEAERTDVFKIAFATAFRNRQDVIRIPQRPAADSFQAPVSKEFLPPRIFGSLESNVGLHGVGPAEHAYSLVTQEDLLTQVPGVGAQTPLVNTILGTEGEAPGRHFKRAPAAKTASVFSFGQRISMDVSARHRSLGAHLARISLVFSPSAWIRLRTRDDSAGYAVVLVKLYRGMERIFRGWFGSEP